MMKTTRKVVALLKGHIVASLYDGPADKDSLQKTVNEFLEEIKRKGPFYGAEYEVSVTEPTPDNYRVDVTWSESRQIVLDFTVSAKENE